jgi:hypothetical protein
MPLPVGTTPLLVMACRLEFQGYLATLERLCIHIDPEIICTAWTLHGEFEKLTYL